MAEKGTQENPYLQDPEDDLAWKWDFSEWLGSGETVSSYVVTVPSGLTLLSDSNDTTSVTLRITGGNIGTIYRIEVKITTSVPNTVEKSRWFRILER